jgi:hypothetical protein
MPCGKKRKRHKMATHKRKKRLRKNRHKKKNRELQEQRPWALFLFVVRMTEIVYDDC